jgi:hypothetical protein
MTRHVITTTLIALALGASATSPALARPIVPVANAPFPGPPLLPVPTAAERQAIQRAEVQEAARLAYRLPAGARWSTTETDVFAATGSSLLELPVWHW